MNYHISSKNFDPVFRDVIEKLSDFFYSINIEFFIIGAMARDIIMSYFEERSGRATRDLDISIAISDWKDFEYIEKEIVKIDGFKKDRHQKQRFIYQDIFEIDIVPFGDIMDKNDKIYWPPDRNIAMSVLGFSEISNNLQKVTVDNDVQIKIPTLAGIFVLKLVAWADRNSKTNKDADDMAFIINNYLSINEERAATNFYEQIYLDNDFSIETAGAKLLGIDIAGLLMSNKKTLDKITKILEDEIEKADESKLIMQILQTNNNFDYQKALLCLNKLVEGIRQ